MPASRPRVRPRFELHAALSADEVRQRLERCLTRDEAVEGMILEQRAELVVRASRVRLGAPQLALDLAPDQGGTILRGRFGPHPHLWTLYLAIHGVGAMTTLGAAIFGLSQHLAGQSPWALWVLPAAPFLAALVWAMAFVGQSLSAEQMYLLRRFVEDAVGVNPLTDAPAEGSGAIT